MIFKKDQKSDFFYEADIWGEMLIVTVAALSAAAYTNAG